MKAKKKIFSGKWSMMWRANFVFKPAHHIVSQNRIVMHKRNSQPSFCGVLEPRGQKCHNHYRFPKSTTWRIGKLYSSTCKQISWQNISWGLMFYAILDSLMALSTVQMLRSNPQKRLSGTKLVKPWRPYNDTRRYIYVLVLRWYFSTFYIVKLKINS